MIRQYQLHQMYLIPFYYNAFVIMGSSDKTFKRCTDSHQANRAVFHLPPGRLIWCHGFLPRESAMSCPICLPFSLNGARELALEGILNQLERTILPVDYPRRHSQIG